MTDSDIIYPPPEMRTIIEKTANFVATYGVEFEAKALNENTDKLKFLKADNPYRAFYEMRLKALTAGDKEAPEQPPVPAGLKQIEEEEKKNKDLKQNKKQKDTLMLTDGRTALGGEKKQELEAPEDDKYTVLQPRVAPLDLDIIKITAQFVARNGGKFLHSLSKREDNNPQFEFLKPTCHLFIFFTKLCDAYTKILAPKDTSHVNILRTIAGKSEGGENKDESWAFIMDKARARWDQKMQAEKESRAQQEQNERNIMESIDWHDFVIVETIQFTEEDDKIALQAPIDFNKMRPEPTLDPEMAPTIDIEEEEMEMDIIEEDGENKDEVEMEASDDGKAVEAEAALSSEIEKPQAVEKQEVVQANEIAIPAMQEVSAFNVRNDYVRKEATDDKPMQKCPLTGEMIPADQMPDHMRILLMDPRYKTQREKALEKAKSENHFFDDIERNLGAFAAMRPDLFGTIEEEIEVAAEAGDEAIARQAGADAGPAHTVYNPEATYMAQQQQKQFGLGVGIAPTPSAQPPAASSTQPLRDRPQNDEESDDEPEAKRQRVIADLIPEKDFITQNESPVAFLIGISGELETGSTELEVTLKVTTKVSQLKRSIANSLKLNAEDLKFINTQTNLALQASRTLAYYNIGRGARLTLLPRSGSRLKA